MRLHLRSGFGLGWAAALSLSLMACGPEGELGGEQRVAGDESMGEVASEIVGGTVETGYPAVVAIAQGGEAFCTGTLIGRQTVLTAAHCWMEGTGFNVLFGSKTVSPRAAARVTSWVRHPGYETVGAGNDVSVIQLAAPVTDVEPMELDGEELTRSDVGRTVRHVGYGFSDGINETGFGTKRQVLYTIRQIRADGTIESGAKGKQTCSGDSGGPALMKRPGSSKERVVATVSYGDAACLESGFDARVDVNRAWIEETMGAWETDAT